MYFYIFGVLIFRIPFSLFSGVSVARRIVDSEGWEKLGLYEYYRAKNQARKRKEEEVLEGLRAKSRSPSPIVRPPSREKSPLPKKRYRR